MLLDDALIIGADFALSNLHANNRPLRKKMVDQAPSDLHVHFTMILCVLTSVFGMT